MDGLEFYDTIHAVKALYTSPADSQRRSCTYSKGSQCASTLV